MITRAHTWDFWQPSRLAFAEFLFFFWRNLFTLKNCAGGIFLCDKSHVCWSTCGANKCMYAFNYSETPFSSVKVLIYFKGGWAMDITLLCAKRQKWLRESLKIRKKSNRKRKNRLHIQYIFTVHTISHHPCVLIFPNVMLYQNEAFLSIL